MENYKKTPEYRTAYSLSRKEREKFFESFYENWIDEDADYDSPCPWGCPWHCYEDTILKGSSIEEMAKNYWEENKEEILCLLEKKRESANKTKQ